MDAARHQIVARAFRRRCGQDRRLEFGKALIGHPLAQACDHLRPQHHIGVHRLAAQIEETIAQADILGIFLLAEHRHRQFFGRALHVDRFGDQFDLAGGEILVYRFVIASDDLAGDRDHRFHPRAVEHPERLAARLADNLGQAEMVAQVDKQQIAVIALAMDPAGQANGFADIRGSERGTIMGAICVHEEPLEIGCFPRWKDWRRNTGLASICQGLRLRGHAERKAPIGPSLPGSSSEPANQASPDNVMIRPSRARSAARSD